MTKPVLSKKIELPIKQGQEYTGKRFEKEGVEWSINRDINRFVRRKRAWAKNNAHLGADSEDVTEKIASHILETLRLSHPPKTEIQRLRAALRHYKDAVTEANQAALDGRNVQGAMSNLQAAEEEAERLLQ